MKNIRYINKLVEKLKHQMRGLRGNIQRQEIRSNDVIKMLKGFEEQIEEIESQLDKESMRHG